MYLGNLHAYIHIYMCVQKLRGGRRTRGWFSPGQLLLYFGRHAYMAKWVGGWTVSWLFDDDEMTGRDVDLEIQHGLD